MLPNTSLSKSVLWACLGSGLIGSSAIFVRLSDLGPITTGFYRMLFALPLLALWMGKEKKEGILQNLFPIKGFWLFISAGAFFAFDLALWNWSIDHTTIVNSTLFNNTAAFFVPLLMWIGFREKPPLRFMMATCAGFVGCAFLVGEGISFSLTNLLGDIVALLSGVMVALYLISLKWIREEISTGLLMFWTGAFCMLFLAGLAYLFGESFWPLTFIDFISVISQAVLVHVVGQGLLAYSLGKIPAAYVALILFLAPVTGAILGWIFYAEALNFTKAFGMMLIMVSIMAVQKRG